MNILHVITESRLGGAQRLIASLVEFNTGKELKVFSLSSSHNSIIKNHITYSFGYGVFLPLTTIKLLICIWRVRPDVIHCHLFHAIYLISILRKIKLINKKVQLLLTEHSMYNNRRRYKFFKKIDHWIYKEYDSLVVISPEVESSLSQWIGLSHRYDLIYNGVNENYFQEQAIRPGADCPKFISVGRLVEVKNFGLTIDIFNSLNSHLEYTYDIFGEGELFDELLNKSDKNPRIRLKGPAHDLHNIYREYDFILLPSHHEGFGLVLVEAMASGCIPIYHDIGPLRRIANSLGTAIKSNDPDAWRDAILSVVTLPRTERLKLSEQCRDAVKPYIINQVYRKYIDLYNQLLSFSNIRGASCSR